MSYTKLEHICTSCGVQFIVVTKNEDSYLVESCPICQTPIFDERDEKIVIENGDEE